MQFAGAVTGSAPPLRLTALVGATYTESFGPTIGPMAGRPRSGSEQEVVRLMTPFERVVCGPLVHRQFSSTRTDRDFKKYGPARMAKLCAARAFSAYMVPFAVAGVVFGVAGIGEVAVPLFVIVWALCGLSLWRSISGGRWSGSWWPSGHAE